MRVYNRSDRIRGIIHTIDELKSQNDTETEDQDKDFHKIRMRYIHPSDYHNAGNKANKSLPIYNLLKKYSFDFMIFFYKIKYVQRGTYIFTKILCKWKS